MRGFRITTKIDKFFFLILLTILLGFKSMSQCALHLYPSSEVFFYEILWDMVSFKPNNVKSDVFERYTDENSHSFLLIVEAGRIRAFQNPDAHRYH